MLVSGVWQSDSVIHIHVSILWMALAAENPPANEGDLRDTGSIPGSGRSPGGGHGNPLQYSCLENPTDRGSWRATVQKVAKSWTQLKRLSTYTHTFFFRFFPHKGHYRVESPVLQRSLLIIYFIYSNVYTLIPGFPCGPDGKESACNARDSGSIPQLRRSPGEGNGNPLQYSGLENSMDRGDWRATVHEVAG